jgi:hypothetical protein
LPRDTFGAIVRPRPIAIAVARHVKRLEHRE